MSDYMLGMAVGLSLGLAIALPAANELVIKLDKDDAKELKHTEEVSEALKQRTCSRIQKALQDYRDNKTDMIVICPDDLKADKLHRSARKPAPPRP